ncbi:MAG: 4a-hydroxytetrahydrobiopterin dehydratase [Beijerinckiaceae bacterium]|jgi:4a-hydroxytetrahydrobiopterin dehydratase|nr:4a-hydroxytetrahydrobiopterin dehydratase [Beijerinckiaceae bacterium]
MARALTDPERDHALAGLAAWQLEAGGKAILRTFRFPGFRAAFGFMTEAAIEAERLDHHPEWSNVYREVKVRLTTHDAGGLTELDLELARRMETIAAGRLAP